MSLLCRFVNSDLPEYAKIQKNDYSGTNLFAYCANDPVNNSDPQGLSSKKKYQVNLYTINAFYNETCVVLNNLKSYFNVNYSCTTIINNSNSLKEAWNSSKNCSVAVINCHGSNGAINGLTRAEVLNLSKKKVKVLIILACYAGAMYENKKSIVFKNIASAFASVVSGGIVVASDGPVTSMDKVSVKSKAQHTFTSRYGWYLYRQSGGKLYCYSTKISVNRIITMKSILNYLVKENLVKW